MKTHITTGNLTSKNWLLSFETKEKAWLATGGVINNKSHPSRVSQINLELRNCECVECMYRAITGLLTLIVKLSIF